MLRAILIAMSLSFVSCGPSLADQITKNIKDIKQKQKEKKKECDENMCPLPKRGQSSSSIFE